MIRFSFLALFLLFVGIHAADQNVENLSPYVLDAYLSKTHHLDPESRRLALTRINEQFGHIYNLDLDSASTTTTKTRIRHSHPLRSRKFWSRTRYNGEQRRGSRFPFRPKTCKLKQPLTPIRSIKLNYFQRSLHFYGHSYFYLL